MLNNKKLFSDKYLFSLEQVISNKNCGLKVEDGFIIVTISQEGLEVLDSSSIKKNDYKFLFVDNSLKLNDRVVDISFLDSFIRKIIHVATHIEDENYEIIKY